jgi:integrase
MRSESRSSIHLHEPSGSTRRPVATPRPASRAPSFLPLVVAEELAAHIERWGDWNEGSLIFGGERGAMLDGGNFRSRVFGPAAEPAGLPPRLRVNDLRHSAVSFAVALGANVYAVQRMVGHSKPSITLDVYGELWDTSQEQLAEKLDAAIRAEASPALSGEVVNLSR